MKVCFITLGCKVNEYETGSMMTQLEKLGYETTDDLSFADIYVLNTCAVTNIAERKSRQMIAKIKKLNANAKIIVTGCASQNNPNQFNEFENVISIIGNRGKDKIIDYINNCYKKQLEELPSDYICLEYSKQTKTRHYINIQDGCNNFCSYCIIPYTRGRSRSRDLTDILNEIKTSKAKEIVLTGINVSDYQQNGKLALIDLLEEVDKLNIRFRLSSFECTIITDDFVDRLKKLKNFCPFFHLSLQSGNNSVLKRMNRHYTIEQYLSVCEKLHNAFKNCCISTDIIVGFKGETDEEFLDGFNNIKKAGFSFVHIFPYSVRKGTIAEKLTGDVDKNIVKERERKLIELSKELHNEFINKNLSNTHKVLIETVEGNLCSGYTENYIYTYIEGEFNVGDIISVQPIISFKDGMKAEFVKFE